MYSDSQFVKIRGLSIHYRMISPESRIRHRVLLVSSPGQTTSLWRRIVPELTKAGCRCVLCDLPGYGLSECRDDAAQDHETRAQFLWGLLDALDLQEDGQLNCWHLMAHGSACGTIAQMAMMQPDSTSSLLMICPMLYSALPEFAAKLVKKDAAPKVIKWILNQLIGRERVFSYVTAKLYGKKMPEKLVKQLRSQLLPLTRHEKMIQNLLLDGYRVDTARLNDLFMPAMVIWGGRDPLLGGEIPERLRNTDFKTAEYHVLSNSAHYPVETSSRAICDFLRGWIREIW